MTVNRYSDSSNISTLAKNFEFNSIHKNMVYRIRELEQEKIVLKALNDYMLHESISVEEMTDFYLSFLNSITPVRAYIDMLLQGHFGGLNNIQKTKLVIMNESIEQALMMKKNKNGFTF